MARLCGVLGLLMIGAVLGGAQVSVIDSGSTNIRGMNIKLENSGPNAMLVKRDGSSQKVKFKKTLCGKLLADIKAAGPLNELPVRHCMKSVSFGSSLFVEYKGVRSPDLSCPQSDPRAAALKADANEILTAAKAY